MNTKCPQCGTAYSVTEAHIGRKVKCKNCSAAMVVTGNGLELQGAAASPPPPAEPVTASAFEFDGGAAESDRDDDAPVSRRKGKDRRRGRDEDDEDEEVEDDRPRRSKGRAPKAPSNIGAYLAFRKMIGPFVLIPVFWLIVVLILLGALGAIVMSLISGSLAYILGAMAYSLIVVPLYLVMIRVSFELAMAIYRTYDAVTELKQPATTASGADAGP